MGGELTEPTITTMITGESHEKWFLFVTEKWVRISSSSINTTSDVKPINLNRNSFITWRNSIIYLQKQP
jgi:hypothetical protein